MTDVVDKKTRSRMMSGIKGKNTKPEISIRKSLYKRGFRYRLHSVKFPGKPDIVLKKYNAVIFIHGCFWHGHNCHLFKWPKSRTDFWTKKIEYNKLNDQKVIDQLKMMKVRICIVWECSIKGANKDLSAIVDKIENWLNGKKFYMEIRS